MQRRRWLTSLAILGFLACGHPIAPASYLDGEWWTLPNPGGGGIHLSLNSGPDGLTGTGEAYGIMHVLTLEMTVAGERRPGGGFSLVLLSGGSQVATYKGRVVARDRLEGEWTPAGEPSHLVVFARQGDARPQED